MKEDLPLQTLFFKHAVLPNQNLALRLRSGVFGSLWWEEDEGSGNSSITVQLASGQILLAASASPPVTQSPAPDFERESPGNFQHVRPVLPWYSPKIS